MITKNLRVSCFVVLFLFSFLTYCATCDYFSMRFKDHHHRSVISRRWKYEVGNCCWLMLICATKTLHFSTHTSSFVPHTQTNELSGQIRLWEKTEIIIFLLMTKLCSRRKLSKRKVDWRVYRTLNIYMWEVVRGCGCLSVWENTPYTSCHILVSKWDEDEKILWECEQNKDILYM